MEIPPPPDDPETKNIIDKLANFVARNGMQFEKMTKEKQKQNPKFAFLFGGEHYNYYQYKLNSEQQMFGQQQAQDSMIQHSLQNAPWQQQPPPSQQPQQGQQQGPHQMPSLMNPFPRAPQMQQPIGGRMPMPNMPPWQNQPMTRPPMNIQRFMPPASGPNMHPGMPQPPGQMFHGPPPTSNNQGTPTNVPPNQQQMDPRNFNMFRQPPPNMPPQGGPFTTQQHQNQFPYQDPSSMQPPPHFNSSNNMSMPAPEEKFESGESNNRIDNTAKSMSDIEEDEFEKEEESAKQRIEESSNNLKQQYEVLMAQQQEKIENAITQAQDSKLRELASDTGIMTSEFDSVLQPIISTCTKDSISAGKLWILNSAKSHDHCKVIGLHLLKRVLEVEKNATGEEEDAKSKFELQLHIVYLINDVLHHASRKHLEELSKALQSVILPIFCMASANATKDEKERLAKLLGLWQKFKYFNEDLLKKLKEPQNALSEYQASLITDHAAEVQNVQKEILEQYSQYEKQHQEYADHITRQLEEKKESLRKRREERAKQRDEESIKGDQEVPPWANDYDDLNRTGGFDYGHDMSKCVASKKVTGKYVTEKRAHDNKKALKVF